MSVKFRVGLGVCAAWLVIAVVWSSQSVLGASLQGNTLTAGAAMRTALIQTLPWIPATLGVIALAARFPVTRASWRHSLPVHVLAFPVVVFVVNVLVVLAFWISSGSYGDIGALARSARFWSLMRIHVAALVYIAIAALTQSIAYYRRGRARELQLATMQAQLSRAKLDALTAQIRPHFLFNTLHTIGHLWRSGRAEEADAMLDHLGTLFQRVQESTERPLVSLDEELETVEAYLAIETARFSDRMHMRTDIDESVRDCAVPPLLLQPLVENAVRHGIAATSAAGCIRVAAYPADGRLHILIEDDGPGINEQSAARGSGTGLRNTRERLAQIFGSDHQFDITSGNGGTRIHIQIPAINTPGNGEWSVLSVRAEP
jgi:two-component system, LytTR family, sensor kinase